MTNVKFGVLYIVVVYVSLAAIFYKDGVFAVRQYGLLTALIDLIAGDPYVIRGARKNG